MRKYLKHVRNETQLRQCSSAVRINAHKTQQNLHACASQATHFQNPTYHIEDEQNDERNERLRNRQKVEVVHVVDQAFPNPWRS